MARLRSSLVFLLAALGLVSCILISWNRDFQVDEVEHIHTAYNLRDGRTIYRDFMQVHPPAYYVLLAPLVSPDHPVASFRRARALSTVTLLATIALVVWCARRLEGSLGAVLAGGFALLHTTLIERGIEVRGDGLLALLLMIALALEIAGRPAKQARRAALQALLLGTALMVTLKAIFPISLFGLLWVSSAWRVKRPALVLIPLGCGLLPFLATVGVTAGSGVLSEFLRQSLGDAVSAGAGSAQRATFNPGGFVLQEALRNVAFSVSCLFALWCESRRAFQVSPSDPRRRFVLVLAWGMLLSLWANPFPWPYVHVPVLPPLVLLTACALASVLRGPLFSRASWTPWLTPLLLSLAASTALPRLAAKSIPATERQFATLSDVALVSEPDDRFFDLAGLYFRPDAYPLFSMSGDLFRWYTLGRFPSISETLRENEAVGIISNYRLSWLRPNERAFVGDHFVHWDGNLLLLGRDLSRLAVGIPAEFEVLKSKRFRFDGEGLISVDGSGFREGLLERGVHRVVVERLSGQGRLILASAPLRDPPSGSVNLFTPFD